MLRSLKRDLASGADPLDLAVVTPEVEIKAFAALADEYGVPLMDETPRALTDTLPGRLLLDLLELPDAPTASRLLAIPELAPLTRSALERGVAGFEAVAALAEELGWGACGASGCACSSRRGTRWPGPRSSSRPACPPCGRTCSSATT